MSIGTAITGTAGLQKRTVMKSKWLPLLRKSNSFITATAIRIIQSGRTPGTKRTDTQNGTAQQTKSLKIKKTCPEESLLQIGKIEEHAPAETLFLIATEFFAEFEQRFGSHVHILDWALHIDESTPHIHERHVFDCENQYGELCPQQEKALEALGFELPEPDKKSSRYNNRKMTFDAACRTMLFDICKKHGLHLEEEPEYGGRKYLEKQDFILAKQKEEMAKQSGQIESQKTLIQSQKQSIQSQSDMMYQQRKALQFQQSRIEKQDAAIQEKEGKLEALTLKIDDVESLIDDVSEIAYDKAVEVVSDTVRVETHRQDIKMVEQSKAWVLSRSVRLPKKKGNMLPPVWTVWLQKSQKPCRQQWQRLRLR